MRYTHRLLVALAISLAGTGSALADLVVTPTRIVLSDNEGNAEFRAVNMSAEAREYRIAWRQMRMAANGQLAELAGDGAAGAASALVRVTPTQIRLGPGEAQVVRVQTRRIPNLPIGEYISHLTFQPLGAARRPGAAAPPGEGSSMQLRVNLALSVPVIVRHGPVAGEAAVSIERLVADPPGISVSLARSGQASVYGNLEAYWSEAGRDAVRIGVLNGVAVYANLARRAVTIPLLPSAVLKPGVVQVVYRASDSAEILSQAAVRVR